MRLIHQLDDEGLPPENLEFLLATHLMGNSNPLQRRILLKLVGEHKRYSEFRPLLGGKADNNLTSALKRLMGEGLIRQMMDPRHPGDHLSYRLTPLGINVLFLMSRLQFVKDVATFGTAKGFVLSTESEA